MSFQIKDKKKIVLLRKCISNIAQTSEELGIHFTKQEIRFFTQPGEQTTCMVDFKASWFSKFLAPDCVQQDESERLQVICNRDIFLQSFNSQDVSTYPKTD